MVDCATAYSGLALWSGGEQSYAVEVMACLIVRPQWVEVGRWSLGVSRLGW